MNNNRNNSGFFFFAGLTALVTAFMTLLMHRPMRKRLRTSLEDAIDQTDRKLDELEVQTRRVAQSANSKSKRIKQTTIRDLQQRLTQLQEKLDTLDRG